MDPTPLTVDTVSGSPSTSLSLTRTPAATTLTVFGSASSVIELTSSTATGASLVPLMVIVSVTSLLSTVPSFAV